MGSSAPPPPPHIESTAALTALLAALPPRLHPLLEGVAGTLARARSLEDVAQAIFTFSEGLGAEASTLAWEVEPGQLQVLLERQRGGPLRHPSPTQRHVPDTALPLLEAARSGAPIWLEDVGEMAARYPRFAAQACALGHQAWAVVPLAGGGRTLGVLAMCFAQPHPFSPEEQGLVLLVAQPFALALDRARALEAERAAASELQRSEARFRLLAEGALDLVYRYRLRPTPGFEYVSPSATPLVGYTPEELYADPELGLRLVLPEDLSLLRRSVRPGLAGPLVLRWRRKDGSVIWTEVRQTLELDAQGEVAAVAGIARDITAMREAQLRAEALAAIAAELNAGIQLEQMLHTALERAVALLGGADGALFLLEPDGRHLRGVAERQPRGRLEGMVALARAPTTRGVVERGEPHFWRREEVRDAEAAWMERMGVQATLAAPLVAEGTCTGVLYVNYPPEGPAPRPEDLAFARAIAGHCALAIERARAFAAEREARERAEDTNLLQERLMAVVGHDLRTPLSAIRVNVGVLLKRGDLTEQQATVVGRVGTSALRMEAILGDLVEYSRVRREGHVRIERRPVRLEEVCSHAILEVRATHPARGISLDVQGDGSGEWDPSRLGQLVSNLVKNALVHSPEDAQVQVRVVPEPDAVVLSVHNEGSAIPAELQPVLFEPFWRGPTPPSGHRGMGLGLFIVREVARAHGGTVSVHSTPEAGTTFTVRLPRR